MQFFKKIFICCSYFMAVPILYSQVTLKDALKTTLANNPTLKTEQYDVLMTQADIITSGLRPNLTLNNQTLLLVDPPFFTPGVPWNSNKNRQDWWQLTKVIQWPGQRKWKIVTSQKQSLVAQNDFNDLSRSVLYTAASQWLTVWIKTKELLIIGDAKKNIDSLLIINTYRYDKQAITESDLIRTQILKQQYDVLYSNAGLELANEHRTLKLLMGVTDSVVVDTSMNFMNIIDNLDSLKNEALLKRTDILSVKSKIDFSIANVKLQKKLAFPQFEFGAIWNPQNTIQYAGFFATIDLPVFSRNQGEIRKANFLKEKFEQSLISTELLINTEVANAFNSYQNHKKNVDAYQDILIKSDKVLNTVQYAYNRGATNIVDYLEAQRSWLEVRTIYFQTLNFYYQSYIDLLNATGKINTMIND